MKTCRTCGELKESDQFAKGRGSCVPCRKLSKQKTHVRTRAKNLVVMRDYYARNRVRLLALERERQRLLKEGAYRAYGGYRCVCCGETESKFLCIDHVNDDGQEHRKTVDASRLYYWLKVNDYPAGFQILCFNCNQGKRLNGGICPHGPDLRLVAVRT